LDTESLWTPKLAFRVDQLEVEVYPDREAMGLAAARAVAREVRARLENQDRVSIIFASAPSQEEFLAALRLQPDVDWRRVVAFHMDEYVGLPADSQQNFGRFLRERLFDRVGPGQVHYLDGNAADLDEECARYATLLKQYPPDITCAGIGENGHLAFNDPPFADFEDPALVKVVRLAERSRQQQVNEGCFPALDAVPERAITLTIPALFAAPRFSCVVPFRSKAEAVRRMLNEPISTDCPAGVLRRHPDATLVLETESAALISEAAL
jgi:glucosamine-6-phosphate deaminase